MSGGEVRFPLDDLLRRDRFPHLWCQGCGLGIILSAFCRAVLEADIDLDDLVVASGIGCAGRLPGYLNCDTFHATHGRAIPLASGAKIANPDLKVVVISGDGDLFAIGGNHFIHAARRNLEMLVICSNNFNYGMTGGQLGPTTPFQALTKTTPFGNWEEPLNLVQLAAAAGATYVARWTVTYAQRLTNSIKKGLQREGFAFIEVVSPCPAIYGEMNEQGSAWQMWEELEAVSRIRDGIPPAEASFDLHERIICGDFIDRERMGYTLRLRQNRDVARQEGLAGYG